jgi:hypothetical protein
MTNEIEFYLTNISKPNFFLIGASKCATTSIWYILRQHPNIFMSEEKEPSFFVHKEYNKRLLHYLSLFEKASNEKCIGEASPVYSETTVFPDIAERIYKFNPDSKIIYIVRNPIDRMVSVWKQGLYSGHWYKNIYKERYGKEDIGLMPFDFEKALFNYPPYVEASKYWTHLSTYFDYFSEDNVHLIFFEDFVQAPQEVISNIYGFLDIDIVNKDSQLHKVRNKGSKKTRYPKWFVNLNNERQKTLKYLLPPIVINQIIKQKINITNLFSHELKKRVLNELEQEIVSILDYGNKQQEYWPSV